MTDLQAAYFAKVTLNTPSWTRCREIIQIGPMIADSFHRFVDPSKTVTIPYASADFCIALMQFLHTTESMVIFDGNK